MLKISNICCIVDFKWLMYVYISIKLNYPSITFLDYCDKTKINIYICTSNEKWYNFKQLKLLKIINKCLNIALNPITSQ